MKKSLKINEELLTDGRGLWSNVAMNVQINELSLNYINDDESFGELCVYFNSTNWDITDNGLIYTDPLFLKLLRKLLINLGFKGKDVTYSEQGMQGYDYVSFDCGKKFLKSWKKNIKKISKNIKKVSKNGK